jgi:hypothetical protein
MSFNLRRFLAHVSPAMLKVHLRKRRPELAAGIDWSVPEEKLRAAALDAITGRPGEADEIILSLERVHHLADEAGERAIVAVGAVNGAEAAFTSIHDRALDLLDRDERLFERAEEARHADWFARAARHWSGYVGPKERWPEISQGRLERFTRRLEDAFRIFHGSGTSIAVEPFERAATSTSRHGQGRVFQLAIYLEAMPQILTEFADRRLIRRGTRPAREVVLTYAPTTAVIDVIAQAGRPYRDQVAKAFAEELFPSNAEIEPVRLREYDLSSLLRPRTFPTTVDDGIEFVRLTMVRLAVGGSSGRITLELGKDSTTPLHQTAREWFGTRDPFGWVWAVTKARLAIQFHPRGRQRRGRCLQVDLTYPNGCNLRDRSEEERLIGEKYLTMWGLVRDV